MADDQQIRPAESSKHESPVSESQNHTSPADTPLANGWRTFGIVIITMTITLAVGYWIVAVYLFPAEFTPVRLSQQEQLELDQKLHSIGLSEQSTTSPSVEPEPYTEAGASREVFFSEKELNSILARNADLATRLIIDLSDNLASAKLLINLDPEFPILGGNTIKVTAGMELSLSNGKPRALLKGVSIWGVPLPNAWLGNMKNTDLFSEFGQAGGFWQALNEGIEEIEVKEGKLRIKLRE